mgnify:CR=1 FL=1
MPAALFFVALACRLPRCPLTAPTAIAAFCAGLRDVVLATPGRSVLLTGPSDPDGDSIGACLGLAQALRQLGVSDVTVSGTPGARYRFLPGAAQMVPDHLVRDDYHVVIVLDGDRHRLHPVVATAFASARARVILDHHRSTRAIGYELSLIVPDAASTCELVVAVLDAWGLPLDAPLATVLYTGVVFDTGGFRHANTQPATFALAARLIATGIDHSAITNRVLYERRAPGIRLLGRALAGATLEDGLAWAAVRLADIQAVNGVYTDLEGIVDQLLLTEGVELACLFIERDPGRVKLSLRSRAQVDVSRLARSLDADGGGHRRAAGVELHDSMDTILERVPPLLAAALAASVG